MMTSLLLQTNIVRGFISSSKYIHTSTPSYISKSKSIIYSKKNQYQYHPLTPKYSPKTENQKKYVEFLQNQEKNLIVAIGPAGCGKTLFACSQAIENLKQGKTQKIILTRPMISVEEEDVGFLPGNMISKMDPWTRPMFDIFSEYYSKTEIQEMIRNGIIEICPLAYMRGRTFHKSFIIADEMQNSTPTQMLMLATRIGMDSKMVIMGDLQQSDRKPSSSSSKSNKKTEESNGLFDFLQKYNKRVEHETYGMSVIELQGEDIMRSKIVSQIIQMYQNSEV
jgi:phosphate starvation-inducible PhoH-like protein